MTGLLTPITVLLSMLCMQWVEIAALGNFSLKAPYVAFALVILYAMTGPRKISYSLLAARRYAYWLLPFAMYLTIMAVIQAGSPSANSAPRQALYLVGSVALIGSLAATPKLARTFRFGAALGIGMLIVSTEVLARSIGVSWMQAVTEFLHGNLQFVIYSFFRDVFNAVDPSTDPRGAASKNEVAVGVLILALIFRSATAQPTRDWVGMAFMGLALGLLLMLNTRSVLVAAALSLILAMIIGAAARPERNMPMVLVKGIAGIALVVFVAGYSLAPEAVSGTLHERFSFDDSSTEARLEQYQAALHMIERNPLTGNGYFEVDGYVIHNLFLSAWVQAGVVAFALIVVAYIGLLVTWLGFIWRMIKRPYTWVLPVAPEWIAPLPITGLFRVWSSGDGGNLFLGEWVAIACFFGCLLANEVSRRPVLRAAGRASAPTMAPMSGPMIQPTAR